MGKSSHKNKLLEKYSNLEYHKEQVEWSKRVEKQIAKLPIHIQEHFIAWVDSIKKIGIANTRMSPYRAIYIENEAEMIRIIKVLEVNKHEY